MVLLSRLTNCPFAVTSGGHAAFAGASNSKGGITVNLKKLTKIELAEDGKIAHIQPGNRWGDVYSFLDPKGVTVVGGRAADVGVGGLTTGGTFAPDVFSSCLVLIYSGLSAVVMGLLLLWLMTD